MENETITSTIAVTTANGPTTVTTTIVPAATAPKDVTTVKSNNGKMKKRGALHMLRVALFMLKRKTNKQSKSIHAEVASKGLWKRLVGSMRPLHLQDNQNPESPQHAPVTAAAAAANMIDMGPMNNVVPIPKNDSFHDFPASPISPLQVNHSDSASSSSASLVSLDNTMSRYASAQNLQELDKSSCGDGHKGVTFEIVIGDNEDEGDEGYEGGDCGDEMIDARAEEFIAQFYEQMRLQQEDLLNRYNEKKKKKMAAMGEKY